MFRPPPPKSSAKASARRILDDPDRRLAKLLSQPLILEESGPPRLLTNLVRVIGLLMVGLIAWAGISEIRETALAQGQVIPTGSVHRVQHLEGGIIAEILTDDGEIVDRGQTLIRFESASAHSELEQLRAREAALALRAERLRAFVNDREPDLSIGEEYADLIADQQAIFDMQVEARDSQRKVLEARIDQEQAKLAALAEQRTSLERQLELIEEERAMRADLLEKSLVSRVEYLESERTLSRTRGELAKVIGEQAAATAATREAQDRLRELDADLRNKALEEMGKVTSELAEVRESLANLEDRVRRLEVRAPVRGIVKGLSVHTVGAVVAPGEPVMEIVPYDEALVAEVHISPRDVGHLAVGQEARVEISTYDVTRYGPVEGVLKKISASTFEDKDGEPYYKGIVELASHHVGNDPEANLILPGMVVDVSINTGSKSLLQYLLKPVYRGFNHAFTER